MEVASDILCDFVTYPEALCLSRFFDLGRTGCVSWRSVLISSRERLDQLEGLAFTSILPSSAA